MTHFNAWFITQQVDAMHSLPTVAQLLVQGGDDRISLEKDTGINRYGVSPHPRDRLIEFSSSTASHVSPEAWFAIDEFRQRINRELVDGNAANLWRLEEQRIRKKFIDIWAVDGADMNWYLHRSGTDAHAMAAELAHRRFGRPFRIVMGEFVETGSKIMSALLTGSRDQGANTAEIREVPIRNMDGSPRTTKAIDQDFYREAIEAIAEDVPVLLIRVDESKSGSVYPSLDLVRLLAAKSPGHVAVLVDCSQLRCGETRLNEYLRSHFMVALTGSKFFGAPAFCGALLADGQWRRVWPGEVVDLDDNGNPNFGLLARWEAALFTMGRYQRISEQVRNEVAVHFQAAVLRAVSETDAVELLDCIRDTSKGPRSLFSLRGIERTTKRNLSADEVDRVYRNLLNRRSINGNIYALGQPVPCGGRGCQRTQFLRLSLSAQMLINVCRMPDDEGVLWLQQEVLSAIRALDEEISVLP
ncbi:hypothetical protein Herbaro_20385 [Herbaspirillum sp. WKF16]|uniref:hypothetical protein n=1 Tax=Herbaspirillum sp. WKF16 TaxID=3028312 RepID=UPI0023A92F34|nr:hypothetical protein [Herbaspirillum sp. WKF16]WDZ95808.1 hypothetical protein Herbaro_20385 [Herbaspirillum sp. WKF16]